MRCPEEFFFSRPVVHYPGQLPAGLVELGLVPLPEDDSGLNEWLLGQSTFPEAHATAAARDARLGFDGRYIEFVPTTWAQAEAGGFLPAAIAVGPKLGHPDFETIARLAVEENVENLSSDGSANLVVYRTSYDVRMSPSGSLTIAACPLYTSDMDQPEIRPTVSWLLDAFSSRLSR